MNTLVCPISTEKVNKSVVRITGFLIASLVILYAITGSIYFIAGMIIDFIIRAFTPLKFSPLSYLASKIAKTLNLTPKAIDKAPKLFAARVGFLFSLTSFALFYISPAASLIVALVLMSFALLESLFDFCVGCVVYTYIVLPIHKRGEAKKNS